MPGAWSTRSRLLATLVDLESYGIRASAGTEWARQAMHDAIVPELLAEYPHALGSWAGWTRRDDERCFDERGELVEPLEILSSNEFVVRAVLALLARYDVIGAAAGAAPSWRVVVDPQRQLKGLRDGLDRAN